MKLYKFYRPDCSPCLTMVKVFKTINLNNYDLELVEINMELQENKEKYPDIKIVPTFRVDNNQITGAKSKKNMENWLNEVAQKR